MIQTCDTKDAPKYSKAAPAYDGCHGCQYYDMYYGLPCGEHIYKCMPDGRKDGYSVIFLKEDGWDN